MPERLDAVELLTQRELAEQVDVGLLTRQIQSVLDHSPFHREKLAKSGIARADALEPANFHLLPLTRKEELLAEQEEHPPYGRLASTDLGIPLRRIHITSGTSGRPFFIALTENDVADNVVSGRRAFLCAGLTHKDVVIHCLNYCMWAGGLTDHLSLEATGATVIPFGVGNTKKLIETLLALRPTSISCTPSYLARLELVLREEKGLVPRQLGLAKGFFGGEGGLQESALRHRIEETWGISAVDANYGMADVLSIFGAECEARDGLHFHGQGLLHVELASLDTREPVPIEAGSTGELVLTSLTKQAQPFVRYAAGDVLRIVSVDPCPCGRSSFRFRVVGRTDDMVVVRGVNVHASAMRSLLARDRELFSSEFEIVVDAPLPIERPLLRVELAEGARGDDRDSIAGELVKRCQQELNFTPRVELLPFGSLPRSEGKTKHVKLR